MAKIHIHTKYSLLDAIIEPKQLVELLASRGEKALCVTEHGNVYSNVEVYKLCKQYGIKYLYGVEAYICENVEEKNKDNRYHHLVIIAKNEQGRLNLNTLVSESSRHKYYGKPRIDFNLLEKYKDGLVVSSACMAGEIQRALANNNYDLAKNIALKYKNVFGEDYYLEYQSHSEESQQILNRKIVDLANDLDIKYIVTTDAHYLHKEDQKYHNIFVQIGTTREVGETYNDCFVQSDDEILEICKSTTREENLKALENTNEIADKCNVELPLSAPIMPHVDIPKEYKNEIDFLKHLCLEGWKTKKIYLKPNKEEYKKRLGYEMNIIEKMGFEGYYLLVWSYANSVKRRGIARGSGGGSLVAYLSNIVDIDPIKYSLYFERFIDVGALDLLEAGKITKKDLKIPDFDLDFGKEDRNKVLEFVINKYGSDRVANLGAFQYIWAKGAIKDIGKVLGIPFEITNEMTSHLDKETIKEALDLGLLDKYKDKYPELFVYASKLAGLPKSFGSHPCFPKGSLVMTDNGCKEIQDIEVGDYVLTHKGRFMPVVKITENKSNNFCIVHTYENSTKCTINHPFYVLRKQLKENPEWIEAKDIKNGDFVYKQCVNKSEELKISGCWIKVLDVSFVKNEEEPVYNLSVLDDNSYTVNNIAVHNCGKVISMDRITYYNATDTNDDGEDIIQGDMHTADDLGLIKADFLGLRTVDVIYDTLEMIGKDYEYIAPHNLNFEDEKVWQEFRKGNTSQIFQFESGGMKDTLKKIDCSNIEDLTTANALFRPGSMKFIDNYGNRKMGREEITYIHQDLEKILKNSYGIIVYQEQLIEIGRLAGLSNPDQLRKATAKKKTDLLAKLKPELYDGLKNRGWSVEQLDELWDTMLDFAKYSFNKSHAAAYAIIAYICMYLKVYHPKEFMSACLNSIADKTDKIKDCEEEAVRLGLKIYVGKYNNCSSITIPYKDGIMIGTNTIKFCNKQIANEIMNVSKNNHDSFIELLDDINSNTSINTKQLEILTGLNFFSDFGNNKYLLKIISLYNGIKEKDSSKKLKNVLPSLRNCATIKKDKIESYERFGLTEYLIKKYSEKETEKQYSKIDNLGLLKEMIKRIDNESMSIQEFAKFEKEYLQYVTYTNPKVSPYYYIVVDFRTLKDETKPYLIVKNIKDGEEIKTRIKLGKIFRQNPFGEFSILRIDNFTKQNKTKFIDGEWKKSEELEDILECYEVIK